MTSRVTGKCRSEIDIKRLYLPGISVYSNCPRCEKEHKVDLEDYPLSYPVSGGASDVNFYCDDDVCVGMEWSESVLLEILVEIANE